jgi:GSH-dependent disulfide-bond oxidoreductase
MANTLDLYTWPTPNGHKIHIMLEECGLAANIIPIDIGTGEQFASEFLNISPNNKIPALVDRAGPRGKTIVTFESGAILLYLAEKTGKFLPHDPRGRNLALQWLMFQMGAVGPMFGQANHFRKYAPEPIEYAINRYTKEVGRILGVMDRRLKEEDYLVGEYSIADMACFPWTRLYESMGANITDYPAVKRWLDAIEARPAVQKALQVLAERRRTGPMDAKAREVLFGATQYAKR